MRSNEWDAILRKKRKREQEGKESAFQLGGTRVDSMRIAREEKRRKLGDQSRLAEAGICTIADVTSCVGNADWYP